MTDVVLLVRTQVIIYRRFPSFVADQKYPAYSLMLKVLDTPKLSHYPRPSNAPYTLPSKTTQDLLLAGAMLIYYSCSVSPLNAR